MNDRQLRREIKAKVKFIKDKEQLKEILRMVEDFSPPDRQENRKPRSGKTLQYYKEIIKTDKLPSEEIEGPSVQQLVKEFIRRAEKSEQTDTGKSSQ